MMDLLRSADAWIAAMVEAGFIAVSEWTGLTRRVALRGLAVAYIVFALAVEVKVAQTYKAWMVLMILVLGSRMYLRAGPAMIPRCGSSA